MDKEEKGAIAYFKECISKDTVYEEDLTLSYMEKALTLFEKYQDRILNLEKENKELKAKHYFITGLRAGKTLMAKNLERAREFEILTKMVDKMAEQLTSPTHSKEWVIDYYKKKVEE